MIEYSLPDSTGKSQSGGQSAGAPIWSRDFLQPLAPGALTPFSASVLHEMAGRSWYNYFDRLGFDPTPRSRVVRSLHGRPYFTLTLSAQLDAQQAGIEPPVLRIGGAARQIARWEKPGLLAGLKLGGNARKVASTLQALDRRDRCSRAARAGLAPACASHALVTGRDPADHGGDRTCWRRHAAVVCGRSPQPCRSAYLRLLGLLDGVRRCSSWRRSSARPAPNRRPGRAADCPQRRRPGPDGAGSARCAAVSSSRRICLPGKHSWQTALSSQACAELLAAHGHRCAGEGELMQPTLV